MNITLAKKKKIAVSLIITVLIAVSLGGCVTFDNFKAAFIDKPQDRNAIIQIGVLEPVTGSDSKAAEPEIRGIQMANKVRPNVSGKMVELVFSDVKSDINAAETAAQTLLVKEPAVILGSYGSAYSLAAGPYIKEAKIPAITITNSNPLVTRNNDYYFRVCYVDSNQGDLLAQYVLNEKKEKTAGVLIPEDDDAALAMVTEFSFRIKEETDDEDAITVYEEYETGTDDFSDQLNQIRNSGVKSVILPGDMSDAVNIINQAADMNLDVQFLGSTGWNNEDFYEALNENVKPENLGFVSFFMSEDSADESTMSEAAGDEDNEDEDDDADGGDDADKDDNSDKNEQVSEQREKFLKEYHKEYGDDATPDDAVALGYDAYLVALDAIEKAPDDATGEEIREVLADPQYSFTGASGDIKFSSTGDPIKTAYINTWTNGNTVTMYTIEPEGEM